MSDTVWNISKPYRCYTRRVIGHWIEMPTDKSLRPGGCLTFFFINCTLLSRFTANFCQLQCSLSAKMWVWSFVLRGMMQPSCNTKQIMLLATEVFLVPFFKRISFYIVKFHFFNSMHPRSISLSVFCPQQSRPRRSERGTRLQPASLSLIVCVYTRSVSRSLQTYDMHNL